MSGKPKDFLISRQKERAPSEETEFAWFGPPHSVERFRFVITREDGDTVSIIPGEGKFKRGLTAWRWDGPEGEDGESTSYVTVKASSRRIDLRRVTK